MALQALTSGATNAARTISIQSTPSQVAYTVPAGKTFKGSIRSNGALYINGTVVCTALPNLSSEPQFWFELNAGDSIMTSETGYILGVEK